MGLEELHRRKIEEDKGNLAKIQVRRKGRVAFLRSGESKTGRTWVL